MIETNKNSFQLGDRLSTSNNNRRVAFENASFTKDQTLWEGMKIIKLQNYNGINFIYKSSMNLTMINGEEMRNLK